MPLTFYFGEGRMKVLSWEIKSSIEIKLKTISRWLISKAWLEERLDTGNGRGSPIVITVCSKEDVSKLCTKELRFGEALKVEEKYWEAKPSSICMTCSGIGHDQYKRCNQRPQQFVICTESHKSENYKCGVTGCKVKRGKICVYFISKCVNCKGNHQAITFRYPARQKA